MIAFSFGFLPASLDTPQNLPEVLLFVPLKY